MSRRKQNKPQQIVEKLDVSDGLPEDSVVDATFHADKDLPDGGNAERHGGASAVSPTLKDAEVKARDLNDNDPAPDVIAARDGAGMLQQVVTYSPGAVLQTSDVKAGSPKSLLNRTCEYCSVVKKSPADLERHLRKHTGEKPFICNVCLRAFKAKRSLQYHQYMDHGINHTDSNIPEKLSSARKRKLEMNITRQIKNPSLKFIQKFNVQQLNLDADSDDGRDSDDMPLATNVNDGTESNNERTVSPGTTLKLDGDTDSLEKLDDPASLPSVSSMDLYRTSGDDSPFELSRVTPSSNVNSAHEKMYLIKPGDRVCPFCMKICQKPSDLKRHMMVHTGEKPFICRVCHKGFRAKGSLMYHMKVNHDAKIELSQGLQERYLRLKQKHGLASANEEEEPVSSTANTTSKHNMPAKVTSDNKGWTNVDPTLSGKSSPRIMVSLLNTKSVVKQEVNSEKMETTADDNAKSLVTKPVVLSALLSSKPSAHVKRFIPYKAPSENSQIGQPQLDTGTLASLNERTIGFAARKDLGVIADPSRSPNEMVKDVTQESLVGEAQVDEDQSDLAIKRAPQMSIGGAKRRGPYLKMQSKRNGFVFHNMAFQEVNGKSVATKLTDACELKKTDKITKGGDGFVFHNIDFQVADGKSEAMKVQELLESTPGDLKSTDVKMEADTNDLTEIPEQTSGVSVEASDFQEILDIQPGEGGTYPSGKLNIPSQGGLKPEPNVKITAGSVLGPRVIVKEDRTILSCVESQNVDTGEKTYFYKCHACRTLFQTYAKASTHFEEVHLSDLEGGTVKGRPVCTKNVDYVCKTSISEHNLPTCKFCNKRFTKMFALRRHERMHTGEKTCFCKDCGKGFSEKRNLRQHVLRFHTNGGHLGVVSRILSLKKRAVKTVLRHDSESKTREMMSSHSTETLDKEKTEDTVKQVDGSVDGIKKSGVTVQSSSGIWVPPSGLDDIKKDVDTAVEYSSDQDKPKGTTSLSRTNSRLEVVKDCVDRSTACQPLVRVDGIHLYSCPHCTKQFANSADLHRHLDFHEDRRPFKCEYCEYSARTKSQLKVHMMRHKGIREYQCELCNYSCVTQSDLNRHRKSRLHHMREENGCMVCGATFLYVDALQRHMKQVHKGGPVKGTKMSFPCTSCSLSFNSRHALLDHYNKAHKSQNTDLSSLLKLTDFDTLLKFKGTVGEGMQMEVDHSSQSCVTPPGAQAANHPLFPVPEIASSDQEETSTVIESDA